MDTNPSLEHGLVANRLQLWRITLGVFFGFLAVTLAWPKGGFDLLLMLAATAAIVYLAFGQYQFFFSKIPVIRTDSKGIYYRYLKTPIFISWNNIQSLQLITAADTKLLSIITGIANTQDVASGRLPLFNKYILKRAYSKIKLLSIAIDNFDDLFSQLSKSEKRSLRFDETLDTGHLDINLTVVKCDPNWLLAELKLMLEKFQEKK